MPKKRDGNKKKSSKALFKLREHGGENQGPGCGTSRGASAPHVNAVRKLRGSGKVL